MEKNILLAHLKTLIERDPDLDAFSVRSKEHQVWLGQAYALVSRWDKLEGVKLRSASDNLPIDLIREVNIGIIYSIIQSAIADLEFSVPTKTQEQFPAGDVYDFFNALNQVIKSAEKTIFVVDPYLDNSVFAHYLSSRESSVTVRLLTQNKANELSPIKDKYIAQHGEVLEVRKSNKLHDRLVFIDDYVCWLLGQSIKDAAKAKPTYLVQAPPDIVPTKLDIYNEIWNSATAL